MKLFCCFVLALSFQTSLVLGSRCQKLESKNCIVLTLAPLDGLSGEISLPDLSGKTSLQIKGGNLTAFGEKLSNQLGSVQKLHLGPLGLREIFLKADLLEVTAADNQIHVVKFGSSTGKYLLEKLDLRRNRLKHLAGFEVLTDLIELQLEDNQLETIDFGVFERMKSLTKLNLGRNHITKLEAIRAINLPNLEYLSFAGNRLAKFNVSIWKFDSLTTWDVSSNDLIYFDGLDVGQQFPSLSTVMLSGNGWHCNWLSDSLKMLGDNSVNVGDKDERNDCEKLEGICCDSLDIFANSGDDKVAAIKNDQEGMREEWSTNLEKIKINQNIKLRELKTLLDELQEKSSISLTPSEPFNAEEFTQLTELAKQLKASIQNELDACESRSTSNEKTVKSLEYTILQLRKLLQREAQKISNLQDQFKLLRETTNLPK